LTVGGSLDLRGTQLTALPDTLTVGGSLDLEGTQLTALPDSLTVGGSLDLEGTQLTGENVKCLKDGDYVPGQYFYADGILTHVKSCKKINGYTFYVGKIGNRNVITDGENYAHCETFKAGVSDLLFKKAAERGAEQYKDMPLDTVLSLEEAKTMYRVITGACETGTEMFVESLREKGDLKDVYTIKEAIEVTHGQYNSSAFKAFFAQK
ncbi:MAG: hypothetical protein ACK5JF_00795, partial [Oscillospiraceae bacterium]